MGLQTAHSLLPSWSWSELACSYETSIEGGSNQAGYCTGRLVWHCDSALYLSVFYVRVTSCLLVASARCSSFVGVTAWRLHVTSAFQHGYTGHVLCTLGCVALPSAATWHSLLAPAAVAALLVQA